MTYAITSLLLALALFLGMLLLLETGRRVGARHLAEDPERARAGLGAIDGAVFGLLGLLLAFTFSGAASRFDARRELIVEETNDIGTAYLRLELLSVDAREPLKQLFRRYLDARLEVYRKLPDVDAARAELARSASLQGEIWSQSVAACKAEASSAPTMLLLPALNAMIDITTTRTMAMKMHPPTIVFVMLFGISLVSSLLAGYGMASGTSRSWLHMVGFALVMAIAVYVVLDLEFPRLGLIRVDSFDQALVELRASMK